MKKKTTSTKPSVYRVGDRVIVKSWARLIKVPGVKTMEHDDQQNVVPENGEIFVSEMKRYCGGTFVVEDVGVNDHYGETRYLLRGTDGWEFIGWMLDPAPIKKKKTKSTKRSST